MNRPSKIIGVFRPLLRFMYIDLDRYKSEFTLKALNSGYSNENINKCLDYAEPIIKNYLPVIYNLTHLSNLTGYKRGYIIQAAVVSKYSEAYYKYYEIRKKNGGKRIIQEPLPNLKDIQYWILNNILNYVEVSPYAKAYRKHIGLKENLKFHKNQKKVLTLDIENFFPSIKSSLVKKIFLINGYSEIVSEYLAKLCCLKESLPQGAPTSPYISNIVMKDIDDEIGAFCVKNNIRYTRYSDDLTFSGDFDEKIVLKMVTILMKSIGFKLNNEKTQVMLSSERQYVTGIIVNNKIQLSKEDRRNIRQTLFFIKKYGFDDHVMKIGINKRNYLNYLIGKVGFGIYLNSSDIELKGYMELLKKIQKQKQN